MSTTTGPLHQSQIDMLLSLDDGEGEALGEIVGEFLMMAEQGRVDLFAALGRHDSDAIARTAHTLKGASANVGAAHLADLCDGIERQARGDELHEVGATLGKFEAEFGRVADALHGLSAGH